MKIKFKVRTDNWEGFVSYNHTDQPRSVKAYIVQTPPPSPPTNPFFNVTEESLDYLPWTGGSEKLKICKKRSF